MVRHERKVVVRLLPPTLKEAEFFQQLSQYYKGDKQGYAHYYVEGKPQQGVYDQPEFSRCYIRFNSQPAHDEFMASVSHQVFTEPLTGDTMAAVIDNALYHKMPSETIVKGSGDTNDNSELSGGVASLNLEGLVLFESHPLYQQFLQDPDKFDIKQLAEDQRKEKLKRKRKKLQEKARAKLKKKKEEWKKAKQAQLARLQETGEPMAETHSNPPNEDTTASANAKRKRTRKKKKPVDGKPTSSPQVPTGPAPAVSETKPRPKKPAPKKAGPKPKKTNPNPNPPQANTNTANTAGAKPKPKPKPKKPKAPPHAPPPQ